jgi:hypothetical protein
MLGYIAGNQGVFRIVAGSGQAFLREGRAWLGEVPPWVGTSLSTRRGTQHRASASNACRSIRHRVTQWNQLDPGEVYLAWPAPENQQNGAICESAVL